MPQFDVSDDSFMKRMLVVNHRSRFHVSDKDFEKESQMPYTYRANPNIDVFINGVWRSTLLKWCLEGLDNYTKIGFSVVPDMCYQWVSKIAENQDIVGAFVTSSLERTGDKKDFVSRAELYRRYTAENQEERDKKTRLGKNKFNERMRVLLGEENYREQYGPDRTKNVYVGWRFVGREE
jgi:phage/plasmid-associated DNA primase